MLVIVKIKKKMLLCINTRNNFIIATDCHMLVFAINEADLNLRIAY